MLELGNLLSVFGSARAANTTEKRISSSAEPTCTRTAPDDAAAAADIRNAHRLQQVQHSGRDKSLQLVTSLPIKEIMAAIREKLQKFRELMESIRSGHFSANNLSAELEVTPGGQSSTATSESRVYSDVSELLARLRDEISEIQSFDGFLLGVHEKIEQFPDPAEFDLHQVRDVEEHMAKVNADLELGVFSLARIREKALRALRCQEDPEPERVLKLLEDDTKKPGVAAQATPGENAEGLTSRQTPTPLVIRPRLTPDETLDRLNESR